MFNKTKKILVTFSGGRDSSATALELARDGNDIILFTFQGGLSELKGEKGDSAPCIRHKELLNIYPKNISEERVLKGSTYLIRKLAIEKTNSTHVVLSLIHI
jgi:tRNA(Ile)-lysidine synthase TilS/MesJ